MHSLILVGPAFDATWPFAVAHASRRWGTPGGPQQDCRVIRVHSDDARTAGEIIAAAGGSGIGRLLACDVLVTPACLAHVPRLRQLGMLGGGREFDQALGASGVTVARPRQEGFWGQSVAEFALGLTICALRRIPQAHERMRHDPQAWNYQSERGLPGERGQQFGDDPAFVNGTISGKRVGVIGMGNIGARYAAWCAELGAEVTAYDPLAADAVFHRCRVRRCHRLEALFAGLDICAPMLPLREATAGMITRDHLGRLPRGALVVLVTRSGIVDMAALRQRVLARDLALAVDVFDQEPLPLTDPLLGLGQVVHTPHVAGRTIDANQALVDEVLDQLADADAATADGASEPLVRDCP